MRLCATAPWVISHLFCRCWNGSNGKGTSLICKETRFRVRSPMDKNKIFLFLLVLLNEVWFVIVLSHSWILKTINFMPLQFLPVPSHSLYIPSQSLSMLHMAKYVISLLLTNLFIICSTKYESHAFGRVWYCVANNMRRN